MFRNNLRKTSPFLFSLLIHASAFSIMAFTVFGGTGNGDQDSGAGTAATDNRTIIDRVEIEMVENHTQPKVEDEISELPLITEVPPIQDYVPDCVGDQWFGGIGVMYDPSTKVISKVFSSYPGYKAGLEPGDTILKAESRDGAFIQGPVGTTVKVTIRKMTFEIIEYTITRGKICSLGEKVKQ